MSGQRPDQVTPMTPPGPSYEEEILAGVGLPTIGPEDQFVQVVKVLSRYTSVKCLQRPIANWKLVTLFVRSTCPQRSSSYGQQLRETRFDT
jgi:hypothetical protein